MPRPDNSRLSLVWILGELTVVISLLIVESFILETSSCFIFSILFAENNLSYMKRIVSSMLERAYY